VGIVKWWTYSAITAPLVTVALSGYFLALSRWTKIYAGFAAVLSFLTWIGFNYLLPLAGIPALTGPFVLSTLAFLVPLKLLAKGSPLSRDPYPVPLIQTGSPEKVLRWLEDERMAEEFWSNLMLPAQPEWRLDMRKKIDRAAQLLLSARRVVAFTGAGISTESHIPDYRTDFLVWKKYDTQHFRFERFIASEESRAKYWEMSQDFYLVIQKALPNPAHLALAELEIEQKLLAIITQNVDQLHQRAGNSASRVIELHGSELTVSCLQCGRSYPRSEVYHWILNGVKVPYCTSCQGMLKPDSVAFGQPMPMEASRRSFQAAVEADLMIIIGSTVQVQPAALLPWKAKEAGAKLIIINLTPTHYDQHADVVIRGRAGKILPEILARYYRLKTLVKPDIHP